MDDGNKQRAKKSIQARNGLQMTNLTAAVVLTQAGLRAQLPRHESCPSAIRVASHPQAALSAMQIPSGSRWQSLCVPWTSHIFLKNVFLKVS